MASTLSPEPNPFVSPQAPLGEPLGPPGPMTGSLRFRLSAMFFLEYFIRGAWQPLLGLYMGSKFLGFTGQQQAWVFNAFALATLTGMLGGGQLADRLMTRRAFLVMCHALGGLAVFGLAVVESFPAFFAVMLVHCLFYVPTMAVAHATVFANVDDQRRDFGAIRMWGSVGWVAAAWPLIFIPIDWARVPSLSQAGGPFTWLKIALSTIKAGPELRTALAATFVVSGVASLVQAVVCATLPHRDRHPGPPAQSAFAPLAALKLLAEPLALVLFVVAFLDSVVHYGFYFWTSRYLQVLGLPENWIAPAMSLGQMMEIVTMAWLGRIIARLGWRNTMLLGILAQTIRFAVYSVGTPTILPVVIGVNLVHGLAYACFFAAVYIFVDGHFPRDLRASAQGLFNVSIFGFAQFVSNALWGKLVDVLSRPSTDGGKPYLALEDYHRAFLVPLGLSLVAGVLLVIGFRPTVPPTHDEEGTTA